MFMNVTTKKMLDIIQHSLSDELTNVQAMVAILYESVSYYQSKGMKQEDMCFVVRNYPSCEDKQIRQLGVVFDSLEEAETCIKVNINIKRISDRRCSEGLCDLCNNLCKFFTYDVGVLSKKDIESVYTLMPESFMDDMVSFREMYHEWGADWDGFMKTHPELEAVLQEREKEHKNMLKQKQRALERKLNNLKIK